MTDAERAASAIDNTHLVWNGPNVTSTIPKSCNSPAEPLLAPMPRAGRETVCSGHFPAGLFGVALRYLR